MCLTGTLQLTYILHVTRFLLVILCFVLYERLSVYKISEASDGGVLYLKWHSPFMLRQIGWGRPQSNQIAPIGAWQVDLVKLCLPLLFIFPFTRENPSRVFGS